MQTYESPESKEFFTAIGIGAGSLPNDYWTLVPLEAVRQSLDTKGIDALKPFSRFVLLGHGYVITTAHGKAGVSLYSLRLKPWRKSSKLSI